MPLTYDNAAGVSELQARYKVIGVLQSGWRPAKQGELPSDVPVSAQPSGSSSSRDLVRVGYMKRKVAHVQLRDSVVTICGT